jgi:hypothetical protein
MSVEESTVAPSSITPANDGLVTRQQGPVSDSTMPSVKVESTFVGDSLAMDSHRFVDSESNLFDDIPCRQRSNKAPVTLADSEVVERKPSIEIMSSYAASQGLEDRPTGGFGQQTLRNSLANKETLKIRHTLPEEDDVPDDSHVSLTTDSHRFCDS